MLKKILFVDDEVQILKSFNRLFIDTEYEIITAQGGKEALEILENETVDLIVSDMKMPNMNGYQLLSQVKKRFPNVVRIILSGYSDEKVVFDALQKNIAKLYILKPWENDVLINTLEKVFKIEDTLKNSNVLKLINNAEELPMIKESYQKIISLIEEDKEINSIVSAIECDYSIVSKLLHIVNSCYYGVNTGSIKRAVSYLGIDNIKNIVMASAFIDSLSFRDVEMKRLEMLWQHSFISNRIFNIIYNEFLNIRAPETAMTAGLLCNVGIVFMAHCFKGKYIKILDEITKCNNDLAELENEAFGTSHQEIGGYLLRWWDIPFPIVEAALYHHKPFDKNIINRKIVSAVHISEKYAFDILKGNCFIKLDEKVFKVLNIDKKSFEKKISETLELSGLINF